MTNVIVNVTVELSSRTLNPAQLLGRKTIVPMIIAPWTLLISIVIDCFSQYSFYKSSLSLVSMTVDKRTRLKIPPFILYLSLPGVAAGRIGF